MLNNGMNSCVFGHFVWPGTTVDFGAKQEQFIVCKKGNKTNIGNIFDKHDWINMIEI